MIFPTMIRSLAAAALLACAACAHPSGAAPYTFAREVERDAIALNEAHTRTINSVITLNILRARDNLPTGYTTLSGVTLSPSLSSRTDLGFSPLGLGNAAAPFTDSEAGISRSRNADARYSVNPVAEQASGLGIYKIEASEELFQRYVESGWPIEVIVPLFLRRARAFNSASQAPCEFYGDHTFAGELKALMSKTDPVLAGAPESGPCSEILRRVFLHQGPAPGVAHAGWIYADFSSYVCAPEGGCRLKSALASAPSAADGCTRLESALFSALLARNGEPLQSLIDGLEASSGKTARLRSDGIDLCEPVTKSFALLELGSDGSVHPLMDAPEFRSFNDMIYFLGETIRGESFLPIDQCDGPVPLFKLTRGKGARTSSAIHVTHNDQDYTAFGEPSAHAACVTDRTGTVLTILSQILLLNQSSEFLEAPRSILER